ncbi:two-component system response regulator YcbB [Aequitasia blattaphilus]|uniref:Stage 0 sporulation protein A homolog n=1 Tax=Aequitasia blattaphilus TaxID=2949332 RepID=A0ABT1EA74_9FIRM|nr:response regulator [Aequitasia blattaphilus]MCP1101766.1 response regulator [Aequitasia blattaphilus]MCR8614406.1 response regulator [Aequitasia blattaphilus]
MKFYLLDDDKNVLFLLKQIIISRKLGSVVGTSVSPVDALEDIREIDPDIVFVDLLMPEMDGITFIKKMKEERLSPSIIMLSQVSSKDMIAKAYEQGIEFFIQKPINAVEVEAVIQNIGKNITIMDTYKKMKGLFDSGINISAPVTRENQDTEISDYLKGILQKLGIFGDVGSKDIQEIVYYLLKNNLTLGEIPLNEVCKILSDSPKSMEQRIRRAATNGMINLAHLGLEDYSNEYFIEYASTLFSFEQIRKEMDFIKGISTTRGNVKIRNFINSLVLYCQNF